MVDDLDWSGRHQMMAIATDADQAEMNAILFGSAPVSAGLDDEKAVGVFDDELPEHVEHDEPEWEAADELIEVAEGDALVEIELRAKMLGVHYPFTLNGASLKYEPSATGIYEFCLAASLAKALPSKRNKEITKYFELVAAEAVRRYLGDNAEVIRTGWPSHDKALRPIRFKALFEIVATRTGEWRWDPKPPNSKDPHHRIAKDEGIDFVAWKPMPDQRPGKLFVLGQCACGNEWDTKLGELADKRLERWFRPATAAAFQRAFALPRTVSGKYVFEELSGYAGLVFDRARIVAIAETNPAQFVHWKTTLAPLTGLVIPSPTSPAAGLIQSHTAGNALATASNNGGGTALPTTL